jgi:hypothetical protein
MSGTKRHSHCAVARGKGKLYFLTNKGAGVETRGCVVFLIEVRKYKENINTNKDEDKKELEIEKEKGKIGSEKEEKEEV